MYFTSVFIIIIIIIIIIILFYYCICDIVIYLIYIDLK